MSELSKYIDTYCDGFEIYIRSQNSNSSVFIEITDLTTSNYHNMDVALGEELPGLKMLMAEWKYLETSDDLNYSIN